VRTGATGRFQDGVRRGTQVWIRYQDGIALRTGGSVRFQDALPLLVPVRQRGNYGRLIEVGFWTRYQESIRPAPGRRVRPGPPEPDPCYVPSGDLLFEHSWAAHGDLVFICDQHGPGPDPEP